MLYKFRVDPLMATLVEGRARVCRRLLAIKDPKSFDDESAKQRLWDGLMHFFDREHKTLPAGLLHRLAKRLIKRGHEVVIEHDQEPEPVDPIPADYLIGATMDGDRAYQLDAVNDGLRLRRGIWWLATNAGKSYCIAAFTGRLARAGKQCLVIVPNKYLVHQTSKDIARLLGPDVKIGIAGDGQRRLKCNILVATYQTLMKGLSKWSNGKPDKGLADWMQNAECVVCDEAHHAAGNVLTAILKQCANADWRIGCTGTVDKNDKQGLSDKTAKIAEAKAKEHRWKLESYLGPVIARVTNAELIEKGISARPTIMFVDDYNAFGPTVVAIPPRPGEVFSATKAYNDVFMRAAILDKRFRATVAKIAAEMLSQGKAPWIFSHSVKQLQRLKKTFDKFKIPNELVWGKHSVAARTDMVKRFTKNANFVVFVSTWSDEGASIPAIRGAIFAGARKAPFEILQRIGRSVRKKTDGTNAVTVVDFTMPHAEMLLKHWRSRRASYEHEGFDMVRLGDMSALSSIAF